MNTAEPIKSDTPKLEELNGYVTKLKSLLDDPQVGLSSWHEAYAEQMQAINDFWTDKPTEPKTHEQEPD